MTSALFADEQRVIETRTEQFRTACKQELERATTVIAAIIEGAPKDQPVWHDYPFGDASFAHELSKQTAKVLGVLRQIGAEKEDQEAAITNVLVQACMWLAWRKLKTPAVVATEAEAPSEPEPEPEPKTKTKRRLSLRRSS